MSKSSMCLWLCCAMCTLSWYFRILCKLLHSSLGAQKINECFLVDIEFQNESFVVKAIKCLINFINRDYSAKPWNRSTHFTEFIKPKQNMSITLKYHRFNRLFDCSLTILYHLGDIAEYLDKYSSIVNGITILDRSFVEMEILNQFFLLYHFSGSTSPILSHFAAWQWNKLHILFLCLHFSRLT